MKKSIGLSKSRIIRGIQCPKSLYFDVHNRDLAASITESQQAIFDQGHEVGFEAQKQYPGGVLIDAEYWDIKEAFEKTEKLIHSGAKTLFEATLVFQEVSSRAD